MGLVFIGAAILAAIGIVFHVIHEYFWTVLFYIAAGILASYGVVLLNLGPAGTP